MWSTFLAAWESEGKNILILTLLRINKMCLDT